MMPPHLERHFSPYDVPNGSEMFENGHQDNGPPEPYRRIDQPEERGDQVDEPEGYRQIPPPDDGEDRTDTEWGQLEESTTEPTSEQPREQDRTTVSWVGGNYPIIAEVWGLPLDRLAAEVRGSYSGHADGEVEGGSGNMFLYTLDRNVQTSPDEADQRYIVHVQTLEGDRQMLAQADVAEQAASFTLNTKNDDGTPVADFDGTRFVASSLRTFSDWGCDIQHVDLQLGPNTTDSDFAQFQEVQAGEDRNVVEAIYSLPSAQILRDLGFTEIQHLNIDNTGPTKVVRARLSKPGSEAAFESAESVGVDQAAAEAAQLSSQRQAAIEDYLENSKIYVKVGGCVVIPTTADEPMIYTKSNTGDTTSGNAEGYMVELFNDEFYTDTSTLQTVKKEDTSKIVAGGLEGAFASGKTVLEIAGGQAIATHEFGRMFPETTFIVTDIDYAESRPVQPGQPGVQLTRSDWDNLKEVPDGSVDTIISTLGVFLHGKNQAAYLDAITRVAKEGAVLRVPLSDITTADRGDLSLLAARGWQINVRDNTVIAIKRAA